MEKPKNSFDLEYSIQTIPSYFTTLFYLGSDDAFRQKSSKKRRRKRGSAKSDALYFEFQPYADDTNLNEAMESNLKGKPLLKIYVKTASSAAFEETSINLLEGSESANLTDYCMKQDKHNCMEDGWIFNIIISQRLFDELQIKVLK